MNRGGVTLLMVVIAALLAFVLFVLLTDRPVLVDPRSAATVEALQDADRWLAP